MPQRQCTSLEDTLTEKDARALGDPTPASATKDRMSANTIKIFVHKPLSSFVFSSKFN
jgi:hypothetical protein